MCVEAVKGYRKARNMESILDEDAFTVQSNNRRPLIQNRDVGIIAHAHVQAGNLLVGDEAGFIGQHGVHSSGVSNRNTTP